VPRELVDNPDGQPELRVRARPGVKIPFWFFGDIANSLFVKNQLQKIFDFREKVVRDYKF
jgi:hypothetical protein